MRKPAERKASWCLRRRSGFPAKFLATRLAFLVCALLLTGCGGAEAPRANSPPAQPGHPPGSFSAWLVVRRREGETEIDARVLSANFEQNQGQRRLTHIVYRDEETGRKITRSIKSVISVTPTNEATISGRASIALFLLERAGMAADGDREAAGLETADAESAEDEEHRSEGETVIGALRVHAWITYSDRDNNASHRRITIVSVKVTQYEDDQPEAFVIHAYCHRAQGARTFMVDRIIALAETEADLAEAPIDDIDLWLRRHANYLTKQETAEIGNPALRIARLQREAEEDAQAEGESAHSAVRAGMLAAEAARRRAIVSGEEVATIRVRVAVRTYRADCPEKIAVSTGHVLGFDTDPDGRPTALFFAAGANAKRGMALYLGARRTQQNRILSELRAPPEGPIIADVPAWLASLPRERERLLPKHG